MLLFTFPNKASNILDQFVTSDKQPERNISRQKTLNKDGAQGLHKEITIIARLGTKAADNLSK